MAVTYPPRSITASAYSSVSGLFRLVETEVRRGSSSVNSMISVVEVNLSCGATGGHLAVWPAVKLQPL